MTKPKLTKAPELKSLPPTKEAFELLRAHIQTAIWKSANDSRPPELEPTKYGWERDVVSKSRCPLTLHWLHLRYWSLSDVVVLLRPHARQHSVEAQVLSYPVQCFVPAMVKLFAAMRVTKPHKLVNYTREITRNTICQIQIFEHYFSSSKTNQYCSNAIITIPLTCKSHAY